MSDKYPRRAAANVSNKTLSTPRNSIAFKGQPTMRGPVFGNPVCVYPEGDYAAMLDTLFEQARDVACANGVSAAQAVSETLKYLTPWRFLPTHVRLIEGLVSDYLKGDDHAS